MPSPRKPMPSGVGDLAHLRQMRHQFGLGLVHGLHRRAGQFELSARLQRDRAAAGNVIEADDVAALHDRLPAEQELHAVEQRADAARAFIRHGMVALQRERRLLVLGADAEFGRRLHAGRQPRHQFVARLQRRHIDLVTRHTNSGGRAIRPNAPCGRRYSRTASVRGCEDGDMIIARLRHLGRPAPAPRHTSSPAGQAGRTA